MQIAGSQTGISAARLRFSHRVVPVGQVPSTGKAETGRRSPWPAIITAVTRWTKSGASFGTAGGRRAAAVASEGTRTSESPASAASMAAKLRRSTSGPFFA